MAIDTMMYQLEERDDINIFEYVERMRTRRTQMVQNVVSEGHGVKCTVKGKCTCICAQ